MSGWVDDEPMTPPSELGRPSPARDYSFGLGSAGSDSWNGRDSSLTHKKSRSLNPFSKSHANKPSVESDYFSGATTSSSYSTRDYSPPRSPPPAVSSTASKFDGFADDDDYVSRPSMAPTAPSYPRFNARSTSAAHFPTHFESDFVPDAPVPRTTSPPQSRTPAHDPVSSITTPLNAFSFSMDSPQQPMHTGSAGRTSTPASAHAWANHYKFDTPGSTNSYETGSTGLDDPVIRSQSSLSNKPARSLSIKRGLKDPAPAGAVKAVAMFDYSATEVK